MKTLGKLKMGKKLSIEEQKKILGGGSTCYKYDYSTGFVYETKYVDVHDQGEIWCRSFISAGYACYCKNHG